MYKGIVPSIVLVVAAACASAPMTSSKTEIGRTSGTSGFAQMVKLSNAPHVIALSAPNQVGDWDFSSTSGGVRGFHLRGTMTNHGFVAAGPVQGKGKLCTDGQDWYSLTDLSVHKANEGRAPAAPYLLGCATSSGFQPASREIVAQ